MPRALLPWVLLAAGMLAGCADARPGAAPDQTSSPTAAGFSQEVRDNFLSSCLDNATNSSNGDATQEQLSATCACILGKVEQEYSESEFAQFEQRLLAGEASADENEQLTTWSTECAESAS